MMVSKILAGKKIHPLVSLDINPGSRQVLENVAISGGLLPLIQAGARVHQSGCLGCIGMGQAPATDTNCLRTFPRNFPGRSGTKNDQVYLVSPETAAAAALLGQITDPRQLGDYPTLKQPRHFVVKNRQLQAPLEPGQSCEVLRGPNIQPFPKFPPIPETWEGTVLLKVGDNITTDHIMPAGSQILPLRSNIPAISEFVYHAIDPQFVERAKNSGEGAVIGGDNYGQGSSREHAALAPRYLGVRVKISKSFARIHKANLINFGILPLVFEKAADYDRLQPGDRLVLPDLRRRLLEGDEHLPLQVNGREYQVRVELSGRHRRIIAAGGLLNVAGEK
jgi:aconitate hydratase